MQHNNTVGGSEESKARTGRGMVPQMGCVATGEWEDSNHIFFHYALAKFMWACVRDLLESCRGRGPNSHLTRPDGTHKMPIEGKFIYQQVWRLLCRPGDRLALREVMGLLMRGREKTVDPFVPPDARARDGSPRWRCP
jgi:hypothetical protein